MLFISDVGLDFITNLLNILKTFFNPPHFIIPLHFSLILLIKQELK